LFKTGEIEATRGTSDPAIAIGDVA